MKKHFALKFLRALLNISQFSAGLFLLMFMIAPFVYKFSIQIIIYLLVCLTYYMIVISISDAIINYRVPSNFELFANKYGSIKGSFLIYLVITCMAFVLAEIFEKAVILKNEHDLTI
ncbi:hypothetical protein [Clostridium sp. C2-6-12]|uniref:hypothetical protein n=1 Tax=Clostridium sp. C2-6-12 TaxID=2698832 RepID=UPI00136E715F|nr:hypothetical protein [Clostridium sp. C2-6-12]